MKTLFLFICAVSLIYGCSGDQQGSAASRNKVDTTTSADTAQMILDADFPFGCADLTKFTYPKRWEADAKQYGQLQQPQAKEWDALVECFKAIHESTSTAETPALLHTEYVTVGTMDVSALRYDTAAAQRTRHLKYRLPDAGMYACYYFFEHADTMEGDYGNLLLYDQRSKTGKVLNIYHVLYGEQHVQYRYFTMDANVITLYTGYYYDDGCLLNRSHIISILPNGELQIDQL